MGHLSIGYAEAVPSSFRDPAGFVFVREGIFHRAITRVGGDDYEHLMRSGLYEELTAASLLVRHAECAVEEGLHRVIRPEQIEFISYPYEWGFAQLRDAALLTLELAERALRHGMILKDASAFNVQFRGPRPVFIDTLSLTKDDGGPWVAYEQFCRHFLAPLALMSYVCESASQHLRVCLDGLPLMGSSRSLPWRTWLQPGLLLHLHAHARAVSGAVSDEARARRRGRQTQALLGSLRAAIERLKPRRRGSPWLNYRRQAAHYSHVAIEFKERVVEETLAALRPGLVFDLGANTGQYSRLAAGLARQCVSMEGDPGCVDESYATARAEGCENLLPLLMDVCNPSGAGGFDLRERMSLYERPSADAVMALALVHHLRLSGNVPFHLVAGHLRRLGRCALVEFVEAEDPMVRELLHGRPLPADYSLGGFVRAFAGHFRLRQQQRIPETARWLCLFEAAP